MTTPDKQSMMTSEPSTPSTPEPSTAAVSTTAPAGLAKSTGSTASLTSEMPSRSSVPPSVSSKAGITRSVGSQRSSRKGQPRSNRSSVPGTSPLTLTPRSDAGRENYPAGVLCRELPSYCRTPPGTCVVFGFGVSEDGQLGVDTNQPLLYPKVIESLLGTRLRGREFRASPLVGGSRNTMAIDSSGQLMAWGWNARGTLGHGHRTTERKPRYVSELQGVRIVQAAIGGWHCLAVDDCGQAYAFGGNEYAQATGEESHADADTLDVVTPQPCLSHLKVSQVAAGGMHSVALTDTGEVWTWGEPWGDFSMQVNRKARKVEGASDIAKIACGAFHNLLLSWKGEVFAWGINDFGQLGDGTTSYATSPVRVASLQDIPIADISAGGWHSLALSTTGAVYVWGRGEYGRLGLGDKSGSSRLKPTLVESLVHETVVQAVCGGTHTMALTAEGRIYIWGRGSFGRLGLGGERNCPAPVLVTLPGGAAKWRVISLCAGGRHSMLLAMPDSNAIERDDASDESSDASSLDQGAYGDANSDTTRQSLPASSVQQNPGAGSALPPHGYEPLSEADTNILGGSSEDEEKVSGASDDEATDLIRMDRQYMGEPSRLGGDSVDGQAFRDGFSSAQQNFVDRAFAAQDSHNLLSDA